MIECKKCGHLTGDPYNHDKQCTGKKSPASESSGLSRLERAEMEQRYKLMSDNPLLQADAIATHYLKLANTAKDLLELVRLKRSGFNNADYPIESLVDSIKTEHRQDLGIELRWQNRKEIRHEI